MEKKGVIDADTPSEKKSACCGGGCHSGSKEPATKVAADGMEDHLTTRLSDAAADACRSKPKQ